ncbi:MAG: hypothetical protein ACOY5W_07560 [Pseudomonadota bacterium]
MTEKKENTGRGIVGLGDLLKLALAQRGGVPKKPHKAPSRQYRRPAQVTRRRD